VAERLGQEDCSAPLLAELVAILHGQAAVTPPTVVDVAAQTQLLFQRLAPLLMLRVLPLDVFSRVRKDFTCGCVDGRVGKCVPACGRVLCACVVCVRVLCAC